jgi:ribonucleoside-diphosphate reductase subunit M2
MEINFDLLNLDEGKQEYKPEVLLRPNPQRFVLFPIQYNDLWALYKSLESKFWTAEEVELSQDVLDYQELEGKSKSFVTEILAAYYLSETFHNPMISNRFQEKIQIAEARCFLGFQQMQGYIYAELFGLELDHLTDQEFREDTVALITQLPSISKKQAWIQTYITDSKYHFSIQVVASIVHLAIFNSGLDAFVFHLGKEKSEPLLPGLVHSIAKLKQDKANFVEFYKVLQTHVVNKVDQATIQKIVGEAVMIERDLVKDYGDLVHGMVSLGTNIDFE